MIQVRRLLVRMDVIIASTGQYTNKLDHTKFNTYDFLLDMDHRLLVLVSSVFSRGVEFPLAAASIFYGTSSCDD